MKPRTTITATFTIPVVAQIQMEMADDGKWSAIGMAVVGHPPSFSLDDIGPMPVPGADGQETSIAQLACGQWLAESAAAVAKTAKPKRIGGKK